MKIKYNFCQCHSSYYGLYNEAGEWVKNLVVTMYQDINPYRLNDWQPYTLRDKHGTPMSISVYRGGFETPPSITAEEYTLFYNTLINEHGYTSYK
jgi:hypothetical protein